MTWLFWLSAAGVFYAYFGYPILIGLLARLFSHPVRSAPIQPSVSVVMAVNNGAALLPHKLDHLASLDYPNISQIIVVSDGSTDATPTILQSSKLDRLVPVILPAHSGKATALNAAVAKATSEIVLFVDIRPEIAPGSVAQLVSNFADSSVGCANGDLRLRLDDHDHTVAAVGDLYWRYENWIRNRESEFASVVGVYGGYYAARRELLRPQPDGLVLDDMFQPLAIVAQGKRAVLDPAAIVYDTWPKTTAGEFQRKVRTLAGNFQLFVAAPWVLSPLHPGFFQLVSHKVFRLLVPLFLLAMLGASGIQAFHSVVYTALFLLQAMGWLLAVLGLLAPQSPLRMLTGPASALLVLNVAAVAGLWRYLFTRGPLWKTWVPTPVAAPRS